MVYVNPQGQRPPSSRQRVAELSVEAYMSPQTTALVTCEGAESIFPWRGPGPLGESAVVFCLFINACSFSSGESLRVKMSQMLASASIPTSIEPSTNCLGINNNNANEYLYNTMSHRGSSPSPPSPIPRPQGSLGRHR